MNGQPREEPEHPTARAGEWIAEALADLTQAVSEPVTVRGLEALTREVRRCADALERLAASASEARRTAGERKGKR